MKFTKMHGLGNDYVYVNGFKERFDDVNAAARAISDRHFGVGGDGMIVVLPSESADVRMRMFNMDGSEGEMCGNGIRCVAKYAYDHGLSKNNPMRIETGRGVLSVVLKLDVTDKVETVRVDMDEPIVDIHQIGIVQGALGRNAYYRQRGDYAYGLAHEMGGMETVATFVSTGNPHMVIFVDDVARVDLEKHGPILENYPAFPRRTNVHFVQVNGRAEATMRTWERGSGVTLACGTGACAVLVAGVLTKRLDRAATIHLPGGDLTIEWDEPTNHVFMTGPATEVFTGEWNG